MDSKSPSTVPNQNNQGKKRRRRPQLADFLRNESAGGVALILATILALFMANGPWSDFYAHDIVERHLDLGFAEETIEHWVNGGLMTLFFFLVGLEIKREFVGGELRDPQAALLPAIAALGGMLCPAFIYFALNTSGDTSPGWAIPVATDIAFVVGVLSLFGNRIPAGVKLFTLTLAIADDIGGIIIIALFYSEDAQPLWLLLALAGILLIRVQQKANINSKLAYIPAGVIIWFGLFEAGVEAAIAGVIVGLLTPATEDDQSLVHQLEDNLGKSVNFAIIPIFAFVNAGVIISSDTLGDTVSSSVFWGVVAGLILGKTLGVSLFTWAALKMGLGRLPRGMELRHVFASAPLTGIGFTVALFIAALSFDSGTDLLRDSKVGILAASLVAGAIGAICLTLWGKPEVITHKQPQEKAIENA